LQTLRAELGGPAAAGPDAIAGGETPTASTLASARPADDPGDEEGSDPDRRTRRGRRGAREPREVREPREPRAAPPSTNARVLALYKQGHFREAADAAAAI